MIELPKRVRSEIDAQINIVPYIDVMLVLLVIFMMTTPIIEQGIEVDLPEADSQAVDFSQQQPTVVSINRAGEYFINSLDDENADVNLSEHLPLGKIAARVRARIQVFPQMKVFVKGDKKVTYGSVIALMTFLQKNGVDKIGIVTQSPDAK